MKANHFYDDPQAKMTTAEIITVTLTAATFFCGNQRRAACFLKTHRYIPHFLSEIGNLVFLANLASHTFPRAIEQE